MRTCAKCGEKNKDTAYFCPKCGTQFDDISNQLLSEILFFIKSVAANQQALLDHAQRMAEKYQTMIDLQQDTIGLLAAVVREPSGKPTPLQRPSQSLSKSPLAKRSSRVKETKDFSDIHARQLYQGLLQNNGFDTGHIYLSLDLKNTPSGALETQQVYLKKSDSVDGQFILYSFGNKQGWVFPNPGMVYRKQVFKPVFPDLSEDTYERSKESIEPAHAVLANDGRWRVESD